MSIKDEEIYFYGAFKMARKALIVDDSASVRAAVKNILGEEFEAEEAENGLNAIFKLENIKDFDLLIIDYNMPGLSGEEVIEEISKKDHIKKLNTIMLTTETDREKHERIKAFSFVQCWIIKPITPKKLSAALKKIFND